MVTVNGRQQAITLIVHATLVTLIILAATVLAALHDLDAQAYTAIVGTAIGLVGGSAGSLAVIGFNQRNGNGNGSKPALHAVPDPPAEQA